MPEGPNLIVANFKKSGGKEDIKPWMKTIAPLAQGLLGLAEIVVCPPYPYLDRARLFSDGLCYFQRIKIGAQNIDSVNDDNKKKTGSITAEMVSDFAEYVILGHSEVRGWNQAEHRYLGDTPQDVSTKIKLAQETGLTTIVCVSDIKGELESLKKMNPDYDGVIAYEPLGSVGTGSATDPREADQKAQEILKLFPKARVIYGGSVNGDNARDFFIQPNLSGVLVGNNSADPDFFSKIVESFPI